MSKQFPIANQVRALREANGQISQSELGDAVGVTRQTIAAIEQRRYSPSLEVAFKIAKHFNVGIENVFYWDE
uniref:helix-turn-helix transcriptional regulator n=1 Tax=Ningiella ruwaisensis TaxID=2364274 RepID=UPI00109FEBF0|nr:helix-turn-helix transcriptional regulator [Ningiella ruwaisensis]